MQNDLEWVKESIEDCYKATFDCRPEPYSMTNTCLKIQLYGSELVLFSDGSWFISDTSGG